MDDSDLPRCWRDARDSGSKYYLPKKPCKNGHVARRFTKSRACLACMAERQQEIREQQRKAQERSRNRYLDARDLPRSQAEAVAAGSKCYFTGKPCKRGHIAKRRTDTRACTECMTESRAKAFKAKYYKDVEESRRKQRERYGDKSEHYREYGRKNYYKRIGRLDLYDKRRRD